MPPRTIMVSCVFVSVTHCFAMLRRALRLQCATSQQAMPQRAYRKLVLPPAACADVGGVLQGGCGGEASLQHTGAPYAQSSLSKHCLADVGDGGVLEGEVPAHVRGGAHLPHQLHIRELGPGDLHQRRRPAGQPVVNIEPDGFIDTLNTFCLGSMTTPILCVDSNYPPSGACQSEILYVHWLLS